MVITTQMIIFGAVGLFAIGVVAYKYFSANSSKK